jgi:hypothetical protein
MNKIDNEQLKKTKQLEWFIGFAEGDGSWQIQSTPRDKRCIFIIQQKDPKVLYKIKKLLKFGKVTGPYSNKKHSSKYFRYRVGDQKNIKTLIEIFNGKLVLSKTKNWFKVFLDFYNSLPTVKNLSEKVAFIESSTFPALNNGWLSGFIDAEGCFSGYLKRRNNTIWSVAIRFSLKQKSEKEVFTQLKILTGGSFSFNETNAICLLTVEANQNRKLIIDYLTRYPLKSNKSIAFCRFKKIHVRLTDGKFKWRLESPRAKARLIQLIQNINT